MVGLVRRRPVTAVLFGLFGLAMLVAEFKRKGDFGIMLAASRSLVEGKDIYAITYFDGFHYLYSPLFAILLLPFTWLPAPVAGTLWKACGLVMLARTFLICTRLFRLKEDKLQWIMAAACLGALLPIYSNIHMVQMSAFLLFATILGLDLIFRQRRELVGAAWLALAINIKLLPLVFVPYLLYRARWRAAGLVVGLWAGFLLLPALFMGWDHNLDLLASWWGIIDPGRPLNTIDLDEPGFHSITAWLSSLITSRFGPHELRLHRNILSLDAGTATVVVNLARGVVILSALGFLRTAPFRNARYPLAQFHETAAICLMIPLVFPHQQVYGFLFLLPSTFYLTYFFFHARQGFRHPWKYRALLVICCLAFFIVDLEIFFGFAREYFWHFKTLTYGALLQLLALALCDPERLQAAASTGQDQPALNPASRSA